jgi:hypothetical protein
MQGRRLPDIDLREPHDWRESQPGDYCKVTGEGPDRWYIRDPDGHVGTLISHTIIEHEDGTITVSPSIFDPSEYDTYCGPDVVGEPIVAIISPDRVHGWHGFLERGVWRRA